MVKYIDMTEAQKIEYRKKQMNYYNENKLYISIRTKIYFKQYYNMNKTAFKNKYRMNKDKNKYNEIVEFKIGECFIDFDE